MLTEKDIERYSRQLILPGFGLKEQARVSALRVALLGSFPVVERYLRGAGVKAFSDECADADIVIRTEDSAPSVTAIDVVLGERDVMITEAGRRPARFTLPDSGGRRTLEAAAAAFVLQRFFSRARN